MFAFTSLSAVDRASADSYLKLMLALALSYDYDYDAQFRRKMTAWHKDAQSFIKRFGIKTRELDKAYRALLAGNGPEDEAVADSIHNVFMDLKELQPKFKKELDLTADDLTMLNSLRLIVTKGSENGMKIIGKLVTRLNDLDYNKMFVQEHVDTSAEQEELKKLVRKYGNVTGTIMPTEVLTQWQETAKNRGKKLAQHARYLELTKSLRESYKKRLQAIVRSSGKPYLPLVDVINQLNAEGIPHNLPKTFIGMIDDAGKFYTTAGKRLLQAPSGEVTMNPEYDPKADNAYVCSFTPAFAQQPTRAYTENYRSSAKQGKFSIVTEALPKIGNAIKHWRADMAKPTSRLGMLATLAELIYETSARVSSVNAATGGATTFGATTLQAQHITMSDTVIHIKYTGKSGGKQHHIIRLNTPALKRLGANLKKYVEGKKKTDYIFSYKEKLLTGTMVTRYLRTLGLPEGFTVHKFRTIRATQMAQEVLKKSPFKKNGNFEDREVHKWVESEILKVGIELGHMSGDKPTANTAIQNYIEPSLLDDFYTKLGIRPSAKIQKAIDSAGKMTSKSSAHKATIADLEKFTSNKAFTEIDAGTKSITFERVKDGTVFTININAGLLAVYVQGSSSDLLVAADIELSELSDVLKMVNRSWFKQHDPL